MATTTRTIGPIVQFNGYRSVATLADLNAIPVDDRFNGQVVRVEDASDDLRVSVGVAEYKYHEASARYMLTFIERMPDEARLIAETLEIINGTVTAAHTPKDGVVFDAMVLDPVTNTFLANVGCTVSGNVINIGNTTYYDGKTLQFSYMYGFLQDHIAAVLAVAANVKVEGVAGIENVQQVAASISDISASLNAKVDEVTGKGLSTEDYTTAEKQKLAAIDGSGTGGSSNVVSVAFTMASSIVTGGVLSLAMTGTSALVGGSVVSFEVTDWNGTKTTTAATANTGTKTLTATTTIGQVLSVDVVSIDNYGNRSVKVTHTSTVAAHTAPTGAVTVNKSTSVVQGSVGNQISFSGGTSYDGATLTYQINPLDSGITFSKITAITSGEVITFTAPTSAVAVDLTVSVQMNDSLGASSATQSVTISEILANIVGVVLKTTGGNGGVWSHIDPAGNDLATQLTTSNFDSHSVFGGMVNQTIDGQSMVKMPKFYFKRATISSGANAGKEAWWISDAPVSGFSVHPAFMNAGSEVAQIYYGKYQARFDGTKMTSLAGGLPAVSRTIVQFAADAAARNTGGVTGFMMHSFWQVSAIQMLYLIENKTMNSQTKTGSGVTGALGNVELGSANYRNIIGLWENAAQWMSGFKTLNGDIKTWDINGNKTWVSQGAAPTPYGTWNYPITFKSNNNLGAAFIEATSTGTIASGTSTDGHYFYNASTTTEYFPLSGGLFADGAGAGLWCMDCSNDASNSNGFYGSRLAKV